MILLFDYDGVIAESLSVVFGIVNELFKEYKLKKVTKKQLLKLYEQNFYTAILKLGIPKKQLPFLIKSLKKIVEKRFKDIPIISGMKDLLNKLTKQHKIIIVTSGFKKTAQNHLKQHGITKPISILDAVYGTSKEKKLLKIKKQFPEQKIIFITDTAGDVREANKVKIPVIAVTWGYHNRKTLELANPTHIIGTPKQLLRLIDEKNLNRT